MLGNDHPNIVGVKPRVYQGKLPWWIYCMKHIHSKTLGGVNYTVVYRHKDRQECWLIRFMYVPEDLWCSPKFLAAFRIIKLWDIIKSELINSENSRETVTMVSLRKSKSLEHRLAKNFEIFRQPSIRPDILPKYSVGYPWMVCDSQPLLSSIPDTTTSTFIYRHSDDEKNSYVNVMCNWRSHHQKIRWHCVQWFMQVVHNLHSQTGGCNGVLQGDIIDSTLTSPRLVLQYLHAALPGKLATLWCQTTLDLNVVRTPETWCTAPIILAPVMEKWSGRNPVKNPPKLSRAAGYASGANDENLFHNGQERDNIPSVKHPKPR